MAQQRCDSPSLTRHHRGTPFDPSPPSISDHESSHDGSRWVVLPKYKHHTNRGVPMPSPRKILEAEYPDNPDVVDALCRIRLSSDAPRKRLTVEEMGRYMEGWDAERYSIRLSTSKILSEPLLLPKLPEAEFQFNNTKARRSSSEARSPPTKSTGHLSPFFSTFRTHIMNIRLSPNDVFHPAQSQSNNGAAIPSTPTAISTSTTSLDESSEAPDILLMTPVEGLSSDTADPFNDGSMTFALAAAPASPARISFAPPSPPQNPQTRYTAKILTGDNPPPIFSQETQKSAHTNEAEAAIQTAAKLIAQARARATVRYDTAHSASTLPTEGEKNTRSGSITMPINSLNATGALEAVPSPSNLSSFVIVSRTPPSPSTFPSNSYDSNSDSGRDSEAELEDLVLEFIDENDDNMSTTSSIDTVRQDALGLRAISQAAVDPAISNQTGSRSVSYSASFPVPSGLPTPPHVQPDLLSSLRPSNILRTDDSKPLPLCEGTEEDHIRAILHCEADLSAGINMNRSPIRFPMRQTDSVIPKAESYYAYNLGPSCSWAPYFFCGKPDSGKLLPPFTGDAAKKDMTQTLMPYIRQLGVTDSPLALPMGTRVINFLPDFDVNSPVRCFLHTSCNGPPPPADVLPILQSLPSFGTATTTARVPTLPAEPPLIPPPYLTLRTRVSRTELNKDVDRLSVTEDSTIFGGSNDRGNTLTIAEYAHSVGAYKEWTHTCIALHMIAGHITNSQVESAATGLADLIRHLVKNANRMGLLSQSVYRTSSSSQAIAPIALHYKQVFWAKFVALAFAVFSEHALRMDLAIGGSEWARQVPEPTAAEALMIPDRSQTPTPTPLTGRVYRLDGFLSLDNMVPEYWWRYGRNVDTAWDNFLNKYYEIRSKPPIYHKDEVENPHNPIPDDARLPDDSDESGYADYSAYKDYGILDDMLQLYEMLEEGSKSSGNDIFMTDCEEEEDSEGVGERKDNRKHGALRGITKAQLLANPRSLNLIAQFTTVRIRGGLQALSSIIYGDGNRRPDAETVLARNQFDMIQAMANDSFHSYKGLLYWGPLEGPLSHTGIRATRQKLANTYRHPLELYSAVV